MSIAIILLSILVMIPDYTSACSIDSELVVLQEPERFIENSDLVFLGELVATEVRDSDLQLASFLVITTIKGPELSEVKVLKSEDGPCSMRLSTLTERYYIFAQRNDASNEYIVVTFAPQWLAHKLGVQFEKTHNK